MTTESEVEAALDAFYGDKRWRELSADNWCQERMRAALDAAAKARWRPIETAPEIPPFGGWYFLGRWEGGEFLRARVYGPASQYKGEPWTHWHPDLPPPPGAGDEP